MKVAIVYPFFAHYRGPIIKALNEHPEIEFDFVSGINTSKPYSSLKLFDFGSDFKHIVLENKWFGNYFLYQMNLVKTLRKNKYDAVIFLGDWKYLSTIRAAIYLKRKKTPFLFWSHGILNSKPSLNNYLKLLFFNLFKDGGFVYDNRAKENLQKFGYKNPVSVIYNSLDYTQQKLILGKILENNTCLDDLEVIRPYLIFTGRLIKERNLELLFEALSILKAQNVKVNLILFGSGPYRNRLEDYVTEARIQEIVTFKGECYDEVVLASYFVNAAACVYPGPIGLTAIHSLTYGTPVITNDNIELHKPEIEAVVDNITGFYFKNNNADSLASKIMKVLNLDENERLFHTQSSYEMIEGKFTPYNQMSIIVQRLKEVVN